jgi:hypothetical protein
MNMNHGPVSPATPRAAGPAASAGYGKEQAEAGFSVLMQAAHAILRVDVQEVERWTRQLRADQLGSTDPDVRVRAEKVLQFLDGMHHVREQLKLTPIPRQPRAAEVKGP